MTDNTPDPLITRLNHGYGLDGGGYSFEPVTEGPLEDKGIVAWDSFDADYIGLHEYMEAGDDFYFAPFASDCDWPATLPGAWDDTVLRKVAEGHLFETEHECVCHGVLDEWCGAAGEPREPLDREAVKRFLAAGVRKAEDAEGDLFYRGTGNPSDAAYPDCHRCDGDGYVESPGGAWAIYRSETIEDADDAA